MMQLKNMRSITLGLAFRTFNILGKACIIIIYTSLVIISSSSLIGSNFISHASAQEVSQITELIYSADFSIGTKPYQLYVERKIPPMLDKPNYRLRILYRASPLSNTSSGTNTSETDTPTTNNPATNTAETTTPEANAPAIDNLAADTPAPNAPPANSSLVNSDGYVTASAALINLNDREAFVNAVMQSLEAIQAYANQSTNNLHPGDAPFSESALFESKEEFKNQLRNQFQAIQVQQTNLVNAPVAGVARLTKVAPVFIITNPKTLMGKIFRLLVFKGNKEIIDSIGVYSVDSLQMHVEDGNILNLKVHGYYRNKEMIVREYIFENYAPIGISTNADFNNWHKSRLFPQQQKINKGLFVSLADIIQYVPRLNYRSSDYSPTDGVYSFHPSDPLPKRTLFKTETSKILQARVFSDLAGIDQDRPNGLIQLEVSKRFILKNATTTKSTFGFGGYMNYLDLYTSINKIEENNKYINLERSPLNNNEDLPIKTIDLLRYTNFHIGTDLNLLYYLFPKSKVHAYLNHKIQLNRLAVRDSVFNNKQFASIEDYNLNVVVYGLGFRGIIRPDSRYGLELKGDWNRYVIIGNSMKQNPPINGRTVVERFINQDVILVSPILWARVSDHGELFFRPQFSFMRLHPEHQYFQVQVGYQFDVFSPRRSPTPVSPLLGGLRY